MEDQPRSEVRKSRHFDSLEQEAFLNLWRTYDRLRSKEDETFGRYQLTPQSYNALRLLRGEHPNTLPTLELAARLVSHAPDITRLLDKLQQRGLVERQRPDDNRRMVRVGVTPAGLKLLKELDKPVRDCHRTQLGHLSAEDLKTLIGLLKAARAPHEDSSSSWVGPSAKGSPASE
jgi:DNA-binding MarR family transcriptional regulator